MNELLIDRLKSARNERGLRQQEVAEQLGIKANTISNWEKGRTEPDIDTFVKLCDIYEIDCASLLSDVYTFKRIKSDISLIEYEHIKKYRGLDKHGKDLVDIVLAKEVQRMEQLKEDRLTIAQQERSSSSAVQHKDASAYEAERISKLLDDEEKEDAGALSDL